MGLIVDGLRGNEFYRIVRSCGMKGSEREAGQEVLEKGASDGPLPPQALMAERRSSASWGAEFYLFSRLPLRVGGHPKE